MSRRRNVVQVVGLGLTLGGCSLFGVTTNPPPVPTSQPDEGEASSETTTTTSSLPSWDDVTSGHPEGATNPPHPVLALRPEADGYTCHKAWIPGMLPPSSTAFPDGDGVYDCGEACGTQVVCPEPKASEIWSASAKK